MAFGIYYETPIYDNRDAVTGIRTRRFNDTTYETSALPLFIVAQEGYTDDVALFVVDLTTGNKVLDPKRYVELPDEQIPF